MCDVRPLIGNLDSQTHNSQEVHNSQNQQLTTPCPQLTKSTTHNPLAVDSHRSPQLKTGPIRTPPNNPPTHQKHFPLPRTTQHQSRGLARSALAVAQRRLVQRSAKASCVIDSKEGGGEPRSKVLFQSKERGEPQPRSKWQNLFCNGRSATLVTHQPPCPSPWRTPP